MEGKGGGGRERVGYRKVPACLFIWRKENLTFCINPFSQNRSYWVYLVHASNLVEPSFLFLSSKK